MIPNYFQGELVELVPYDIDADPVEWEKWDHDTEYQRLLNIIPAAHPSISTIKGWFEQEDEESVVLTIKTCADHQTIGFVILDGFDWVAANGWVAIAIGAPDYRGKGYGTEAMQLTLKFAFLGLNLHRVNLSVFDFNQRALRSYEKAGFQYEGTLRDMIYKEDQRWNAISMGVLRSDWESTQKMFTI